MTSATRNDRHRAKPLNETAGAAGRTFACPLRPELLRVRALRSVGRASTWADARAAWQKRRREVAESSDARLGIKPRGWRVEGLRRRNPQRTGGLS